MYLLAVLQMAGTGSIKSVNRILHKLSECKTQNPDIYNQFKM